MTRSEQIVQSYLEKLPPDETVVWTGRTNEKAFMQREWQKYKTACIRCGTIPAASIVGLTYDPNPLLKLLLCVTLLVFFWLLWEAFWTAPGNYSHAPRFLANTDYLHAPHYALTNKQFITAVFDEGNFIFHKAELSNIITVGPVKIDFAENTLTNSEFGTIICRCYYSLPTTLSKKIKIELIENPREVENLIRKAVLEIPDVRMTTERVENN